MMAPTLEGFYFDPRKEKYFKILPHHIAPRGAVYSEQAIRKQDEKNQVGFLSRCTDFFCVVCTM